MNKTYIKRQLTLNKLGIPMNEDIQEYFDYFNELIGDPSDLIKEYGEYYNIKGYMYSINNIKLLFYDEENKRFEVDYENIWKKFARKFGLNYTETKDLLTCLLGEAFKCKVTTALILTRITAERLGEAFKCKVTTALNTYSFRSSCWRKLSNVNKYYEQNIY